MSYQDFKNTHLGNGYDIDGWFGDQCLTGEYLVKLKNGSYKLVKDIVEGDVLSTGNTVVSNESKQSTVYWLRTSQGWFKVTKDHKVFLKDGTYKPVTELKQGDSIALDLSESDKVYDLTDDELRFFGFWLGDGSVRKRWKNSETSTVFITVGTEDKLEYLKGLDINNTYSKHSNGKADIVNLQVRFHPELLKVIQDFSNKELTDVFTKEQYLLIIEGYLKADGHIKKGTNTNVASSVNKQLLVTLQHGCHINGISACLSKRHDREATNLSDNPKPIWRLSVNKDRNLLNNFISLEEIGEDTIYVLNTDGDHSYYADNQLHHNCWDGYAEYCNYLGVPYANCTDSGYAQDLWTQRHSNGILNYFDEVEVMQPGDVAIFAITPSTPYSHVAIFDSDAGNGYGNFLGQNQGGTQTNPNGGGVFNIVALPYSATFPTAFRPKQSNNTAVVTNNSEPSSVVSGMKKDDYFIDVSAYQPGDLTDICNASGTRNTIIKVTEGIGWLSPVVTQQTNTSNCVGYYHFARFGGDVGLAQAEADFFISNLPSKTRYLVCDYEDSASGNVQANTDAVIAFMDKCKQAGFEPIYYSYKPYTLANVYIDQVTAKYPNSLWIAGYPNYEVTPTPYWGVYPGMEHMRWWQFTSTGIAGGLDKNIVLIDDEVTSSSVEEEDENMNFVVRNQTGDSGYVAVVNGRVFGIGDMETVFQLQNAGAKHLNLPDADFGRFIDSQSRDAQEIKQAIADANAKVVEAIEKIKSTSVQDALGKVTIKGNLEVSNEG